MPKIHVLIMPEAATILEPVALPEQKLVRFQLGDEHFAFSVDSVTGIIRWREVTPLPSDSAHLLGLANLRGRTMPVSDLRALMGIKSTVAVEAGYVIVTDGEHGQIGFLVDDVAEVITITADDIQERVSDSKAGMSGMTLGIVNLNDELISIVDIAAMMGATE